MDRAELGKILKTKRREKGLSQSELNKLLGYVESSKFISQIERGVAPFPDKKLSLFAKHLDIPEVQFYNMVHPNAPMPQILFTMGTLSRLSDIVSLSNRPSKNMKINQDLASCIVLTISGSVLKPLAHNAQKVILHYSKDIFKDSYVICAFQNTNRKYSKLLESSGHKVIAHNGENFIAGKVLKRGP